MVQDRTSSCSPESSNPLSATRPKDCLSSSSISPYPQSLRTLSRYGCTGSPSPPLPSTHSAACRPPMSRHPFIFTTDLSRSSICMILFCKSALTHNASANFISSSFIDSATKLAATYAKPQHMQKDLNLIRTIFYDYPQSYPYSLHLTFMQNAIPGQSVD